MSSAEITLGANLFVRATEEKIDQLVKDNPDYVNLKLSLGDMGRWLVNKGCVNRDADGNWQINNKMMDKVSEEDAKRFLPHYETVVMNHEFAGAQLIRDGKAGYMTEFRELHSDTIFEVVPETITRVNGEDMHSIAASSLNLLQAVHDDPANAAFVTGMDSASLDELSDILYKSGYLMPGENPDRRAPLGDQSLRGTPEEQEALYNQALSIALNLELPETVNQGDKPMTAATMLKRSVLNAQVEAVELDGSIREGWDSDLRREDTNAIYNVLHAGIKLACTSDVSTQGFDMVEVDQRTADDLKVAVAHYYDLLIDNCLGSGNFGDPQISIQDAKDLNKAVGWLSDIVNSDHQAERYTGDDGGMMTQEGQTMAEGSELGDDFVGGMDDGDSEEGAPTVSNADGDLDADIYGASDRKFAFPEALMRQVEPVLRHNLENQTFEYLRNRAGRPFIEIENILEQAAYGSLSEAMGELRQDEEGSRVAGHNPKVFTRQQMSRMHPDNQARVRAIPINPGRSPFEDYRHGSPSISAKRLKRYIDNNMVTKDGKPNLALRHWLRSAHEDGTICEHRPEGEAAMEIAAKFIARDRHEFESRRDRDLKKKGLTEVTFKTSEIARMVQVKEASGTGEIVRLSFDEHGTAWMSDKNEDVPKVFGQMAEVPKEAGKSPREFGGMVQLEWLKAAQQTGAEEINILISGEAPYAAIGKIEQAPERSKSKSKPKQIVLS